jgi:hypothetical protein
MDRTCGTHGREEKCIYILIGKPEEKIILKTRRIQAIH